MLAAKNDGAGIGRVDARQRIDESRLTGTIGANQGADLAALHAQVRALQGLEAAKRQGKVFDLEQYLLIGRLGVARLQLDFLGTFRCTC